MIVLDETYNRAGRFDIAASARMVFTSFSTALSYLQSFRVAVPLLAYFGLKLLILALYLNGISEPVSSFWALFVRGLDGENMSHYPVHLIVMQTILGRLEMVLGIVVHPAFQGATVLLIASAIRRQAPSLGGSFRETLRKYPRLVGVSLIMSILILAFVHIPSALLGDMRGVPGLIVPIAAVCAGLVVQAFFLYAMILILLEDRAIPGAIGESFRLAWNTIVTSLLLVGLPFILTLPVLLLGMKGDLIAFHLSPDFLVHVQIAGEIMILISTYLVIGGATVTFSRKRAAAEENRKE